jgi:tetratricopeptide (TPR) repeat protein
VKKIFQASVVCFLGYACAPSAALQTSAVPSVQVVQTPAQEVFGRVSREALALPWGSEWDAAAWRKKLEEVLSADSAYEPALYNTALWSAGELNPVLEGLGQKNFVPALQHPLAYAVARHNISLVEAEKRYRFWLKTSPQDVVALMGLSVVMLKMQRVDEAEVLARDVLSWVPSCVLAYEVLGYVALARGQMGLASLIVQKGLLIKPQHTGLERVRILILAQREGAVAAVPALQTFLQKNPQDAWANSMLATWALRVHDHSTALMALEALKNTDVPKGAWHVAMGVALAGVGKHDEALASYTEALKDPSVAVFALWNKAVLLDKRMGQYGVSVSAYEAVLAHPEKKALGAEGPIKVAITEALAKQKAVEEERVAQEIKRAHEERVKGVCAQWLSGAAVDEKTLGSSEERAAVAWELLNTAQGVLSTDVPESLKLSACAFRWGVSNEELKTQVCASLHVAWAKVVYGLGCVQEASVQVQQALQCDPTYQEALLIVEQLKQEPSQETKCVLSASPPSSSYILDGSDGQLFAMHTQTCLGLER